MPGAGVGRGRWRRPAGRGGLLRHGPAAPGVSVPRGVGRGRDRRRGGVACGLVSRPPPPRLACPPPPVQVPSASRRGGLKTLWGSPVRLGSGRSGPWGGGVPFSPRLRRPPHPTPPGPGLPCRATVFARPSGGGCPAAPPGRACACAPRPSVCVCGGGRWEPPGRLWGCPSSAPRVVGGGRMPRGPTFPTFSESGLACVSTGRPEAPLRGNVLCQGGPPLRGSAP